MLSKMRLPTPLFTIGSSGVLALMLTTSASGQTPLKIEGYGAATRGGAGGDVYHVTSLANDGPGTLRRGLAGRDGRSPVPRTIVFDVGGTITLSGNMVIGVPYLTIDGFTAPSPGITIRQNTIKDQVIIGATHDIIVRGVRFYGLYVDGAQKSNDAGPLGIDADRSTSRTASNLVLDHVTVRGSTDSGPDLWGDMQNVTVQWCLFFDSLHPTTVSGPGTRTGISMHHNVYARNGERNPQLVGAVRSFDYVNNVVYSWAAFPSEGSGYGIRVKNDPALPSKVQANIVNNAFVPAPGPEGFAGWALVYGDKPGPDISDGGPATALQQGAVYTRSRMGSLWVSGNILPSQNRDHFSTVTRGFAAPPVTTWPAAQLGSMVVPSVGVRYRTADEQALIAEVGRALASAPSGTTTATTTGTTNPNEEDPTEVEPAEEEPSEEHPAEEVEPAEEEPSEEHPAEEEPAEEEPSEEHPTPKKPHDRKPPESDLVDENLY